jgi:hypothetical protein
MQALHSAGITSQTDITKTIANAGREQLLNNPDSESSKYMKPYIDAYFASIATTASMPAFALGGYHSGGMRLVGENGPELEFTGSARYFSFDQTRELFSGINSSNNNPNDALIEEIRKLNAQVSELQQVVAEGATINAEATNKNTEQIAEALNNTTKTYTHVNNVTRKVNLQ